MKRIRIPAKKTALYALLLASMVLLNFALPQREPLSFALYEAALFCGLDPFLLSAFYLLSSVTALSLFAALSAAVQMAFLLAVHILYRKIGRKMKLWRLLYAALAQLPFIFLFPHTGYALFPLSPTLTKLILALFLLVTCVLFEGGLNALLHRVFRSRLSAVELTELALLWVFLGMGALFSVGGIVFYAVALTALLAGVVLFGNSASVPFAVVLALPLCLAKGSALPLAMFAVYACAALLFLPYGRLAAGAAFFVAFAGAQYAEGLYLRGAVEIVFTLLACLLPVLLAVFLPERTLACAKKTLLFYRERTLPRIAVNRSRRAVGEQLYEVSALFREIETAFSEQDEKDVSCEQMRARLLSSLCADCPNYRTCESYRVFGSMDKLIAVGKAKGRVNLIDLPADLSAHCVNASGLLFTLNGELAEYAQMNAELETARQGRLLLARQAHGVSEILKEIALSQSAEYAFSDEEKSLSSALAKEGMLSSEIFLYGEDEHFTASLTLEEGTDAKTLCRVASGALKVPLSLAEKIPLTNDRACFVLKRRPRFDAAFGLAACPKEGEIASGDTHSVLKIDERRFLVALSDGMGSGEEARAVSDRTLSLLESFYKAKMPSETVLSTVNSLIAYSSEETFSCLDLAAVNLDTGIADVVKIGSPPAFVLSGETLQVLEGESLPIGALEAVRPACLRVDLKADDFLIFMSDGVTSAFGSSSELCAYLSRLQPLNPQSLAEEILKTALGYYDGRAEDDMTVLTVKLAEGE